MLRKLCTADNWNKLSLLKLKEELARRGLKRTGTREDLIKRLVDNEDTDKLSSMKKEVDDDLDKSSFSNLSKPFLLKEIMKRRPDLLMPSKYTKKQLLESLSSLLIDERGQGTIDLRYLMLKSTSGLDEISLPDIFQVLNDHKDPYQISQLDISIFLNTEPTCMAPVWNYILDRIELASFPQLISYISSISVLQEFFKKRINAEGEKFSSENIEKILVRARKISIEASSLEIAKLLNISNSLLKEPTSTTLALKHEMLDRAGNLEDVSPLDLLYFLENLPAGCYNTHEQLIKNTLERVYDIIPKISSEKLLGLLFGLYNSGAEIPFNIIYYVDLMPKDFLKKLSSVTLTHLAKILSEKMVLSEDMGKNIIEVLAAHNLLDSGGLALYVNTLYTLHINNSFSQVINRINLLSKCLIHDNNLDLDSLLRLCVIYLPHMINEELFSKLLIELSAYENDDKIFIPKIDLLEEIQKNLLSMSEELPIYNYQFHSFRVLGFKEKDYLINKIHQILKFHTPSSPMVFNFYNSLLHSQTKVKNLQTPESVKISLFSTEITSENLLPYTMCLWKNRGYLNSDEVLSIVNKGIEALRKLNPENMEALYYLVSSVNKIPENLKKEDVKISNYYFAICYTLNWTPENIDDALSNLEIMSLFGEPLIKTMIMIIDKSQDKNIILKASANLNFNPRSQPKISKELAKYFVKIVIDSVQDINYYAFSSFILENFDAFIEQNKEIRTTNHEIVKIFAFLKNNWEQVNPALQNKIDKAMDISINEILIMNTNAESRKKIAEMQSKIDYTVNNLNFLEALSKHKLFLHQAISKYLHLIGSIRKEQDLVNLISHILKILSFSGNQKGLFDEVYYNIEKYKIWASLSLDDLINFFFIYHGTGSIIGLPYGLEDKFKAELFQADPAEQKIVSLKNSFKYYKSFKYTTEFEPRLAVSNNLKLREESPEVNSIPELPTSELMRYLKIKAIHNKYGIPASDDCNLAVKMWHKQRDKDLSIKNLKQGIIDFLNETIGFRVFGISYTENFVDDKTGWRIDMMFGTTKIGFLLFSEADSFYNEKGDETGIDVIHHLIKAQLQALLRYNIFPLTPKYWNNMTLEKKQILFAPLFRSLKKK
ncbi:hypothetical protein SteCoe_13768 [Stentor coeruleus]|uniref:SAP domain-containing protein n=1 Tax=Stentor coeruleus TaxID=5963 RepID=A0A1R2C7L4_9CILI|nr:hypothetical protein SteCoe_13768 [Stentor coeruleus]